MKSKLMILYVLLLANCIYSNDDTQFSTKSETPHWSYSGNNGPNQWGSLCEAYNDCKNGNNQSPIDITNEGKALLDKIQFHYTNNTIDILNNGHTIQCNTNSNSYIIIGDVQYDLLQFHFHSPSEHAINGVRFPLELHLVHKSSDDKLAVIGVLLQYGSTNDELNKIWNKIPKQINESYKNESISINANNLLPTNTSYSYYNGSLTTPPCTEGVRWFVLKKPIEVSKSQINTFVNTIGANTRPLQKLNKRNVFSN